MDAAAFTCEEKSLGAVSNHGKVIKAVPSISVSRQHLAGVALSELKNIDFLCNTNIGHSSFFCSASIISPTFCRSEISMDRKVI